MTISAETRAKIHQLRGQCKSVRLIATELGVAKSTVSDILKSVPTPETSTAPAESPANSSPIVEAPKMPGPTLEVREAAVSEYLGSLEPSTAAAPDSPENKRFLSDFAKTLKEGPAPEEEGEAAPVRPKKGRKPRAPKEALAVASATLTPPPETPPPPPPMDKGALIATIASIVTTFGPSIQAHVKDPQAFVAALPGKSLTDLKTTLELLERSMLIYNSSNGMRHMFGMFAGAIELGASRVGLKSQGYQAAVMSQDQELREIFLQLAHTRADSLKRIMGPEARLCALMAQSLLAVDARNRTVSAPGPAPDVQDKYSDL